MPQNSIKNCFLVVLAYFFNKNGPNDLVRGLFSSLVVGRDISPICRLSGTSMDPFGDAQMPQNSIKKLFSGCFGPFGLEAYFQAWILGHTSRPFAGLGLPVRVHLGVP
jgi:hypothetical protein